MSAWNAFVEFVARIVAKNPEGKMVAICQRLLPNVLIAF